MALTAVTNHEAALVIDSWCRGNCYRARFDRHAITQRTLWSEHGTSPEGDAWINVFSSGNRIRGAKILCAIPAFVIVSRRFERDVTALKTLGHNLVTSAEHYAEGHQ